MHNVVTTITGAVGRAICAIPESRNKQIERRIAKLISKSGGRLTDNVEREIALQILGEDQAFTVGPINAVH
jgi:hypothetical protein